MKGFALALYFIFVIVLTVFGVYFAKHNADPVIIKFFYMNSQPTAQWIVLMISFMAGFFIATLLLTWKLIRVYLTKKKYMHSYEQLRSALEQKIKDLKTDGQE